jgi:biotin transport system substrate-specific component
MSARPAISGAYHGRAPAFISAIAGDTSRAVRAAAVLFVAALTAAAAQVSFPLPFTPVPFTLQPMVVLIGGAALGPRLGAASQVLYLGAGIAGLPVFAFAPALPQGAARLFGPTGGYLLSYPIAALVTGLLATRRLDRRVLTSVVAMAAGLAVVFAGGVLWMAYLQPAPIGLAHAIAAGLVPFLLADAIKIVLAGLVMPAAWRLLGEGPSTSGS